MTMAGSFVVMQNTTILLSNHTNIVQPILLRTRKPAITNGARVCQQSIWGINYWEKNWKCLSLQGLSSTMQQRPPEQMLHKSKLIILNNMKGSGLVDLSATASGS